MSRIGKHPVVVPGGVTVAVEGQKVSAKGKLGELAALLPPEVEITFADGRVTVLPRDKDEKRSRSMWGMSRSIVQNLVKGVSEGYTRKLEIAGVGYRAAVDATSSQTSSNRALSEAKRRSTDAPSARETRQ